MINSSTCKVCGSSLIQISTVKTLNRGDWSYYACVKDLQIDTNKSIDASADQNLTFSHYMLIFPPSLITFFWKSVDLYNFNQYQIWHVERNSNKSDLSIINIQNGCTDAFISNPKNLAFKSESDVQNFLIIR